MTTKRKQPATAPAMNMDALATAAAKAAPVKPDYLPTRWVAVRSKAHDWNPVSYLASNAYEQIDEAPCFDSPHTIHPIYDIPVDPATGIALEPVRLGELGYSVFPVCEGGAWAFFQNRHIATNNALISHPSILAAWRACAEHYVSNYRK